jgi:hypothetical protein
VVVTARFKATTTGTATSVVFNGTVRSLDGQLLGHSDLVRRTKHHAYHEPEVWAQVATGHGLGVASTSYKLGCTDGANADLDMRGFSCALSSFVFFFF